MDPIKTRNSLRTYTLGRFALWLLSLAYLAAVSLRRALYSLGALKSRELPVPVVCFGNISAGGTGKTSTVVAAARELAKAGRKPAILMRGYKRDSAPGTLTVLAPGREFSKSAAGDEAQMLYSMLEAHKVPVLVCADRYRSGTAAVAELGADVLLMDDGFQHFALRRDLDIAIVNATAPFLDDGLLPLGNLREPASAVRRAGAVILSHCEGAAPEAVAALRAGIASLNPAAEIYESTHVPEFFVDPLSGSTLPLADLKKKEVAALSAIGDPESFEASLARLGLRLKQIWRYPDHHPFTALELRSAAQAAGGLKIITTYKDFVRFPAGWKELLPGGVLILSVRIAFNGDGWSRLAAAMAGLKKGGA